MKRLSLLALGFAVLSVVFFILLIFFRSPFVLYGSMSYQDVLDILTPLVLIPIYWLMFRNSGKSQTSQALEVVFLIFAAFWVMGQGMHLSANSINNLAEKLVDGSGPNILGTDISELTYFYDEYLSHFLWHIGVIGLAGVLVYREWRDPAGIATIWWAAVVGGILYGFTLFAIFLEGQTALLGFPFAVLFTLLTAIWGRKNLGQRPLLGFFFVSFLVAALFFLGWGFWFGGFPEFTELGLI